MEFTSQVSLFEDKLWSSHLPVPTPAALHFKEINSDNRVICHLNDQYYLKALRKELAVILLEHLRKLNGKLDFKQLRQDFIDGQGW